MSEEFICAIWSSYSKSLTARSPLTIACAPRSWQNVVSSPVKPATVTLSSPAVACSSIASRSSAVKSRFLDLFTPTATITSSKRVAARRTMSRCPLVTGSNDPGHTARLT